MRMEEAPGFDMDNRDPNNINTHLQVMWDDLVAEPEGIRSASCIWRTSFKIFRCTSNCTYNLLSAIFFIPISICIGLRFACLSFQHIWCLAPLMRDLKINCFTLRTFGTLCCDTLLGPTCEAMGLIFSRFKFAFLSQKSSSCSPHNRDPPAHVRELREHYPREHHPREHHPREHPDHYKGNISPVHRV